MLLALHLFTRHVGDTVLQGCSEELIRHGILEEVPHDQEEPHYRLAARHEQAFNLFWKELISFRGILRSNIEAGLGGT